MVFRCRHGEAGPGDPSVPTSMAACRCPCRPGYRCGRHTPGDGQRHGREHARPNRAVHLLGAACRLRISGRFAYRQRHHHLDDRDAERLGHVERGRRGRLAGRAGATHHAHLAGRVPAADRTAATPRVPDRECQSGHAHRDQSRRRPDGGRRAVAEIARHETRSPRRRVLSAGMVRTASTRPRQYSHVAPVGRGDRRAAGNLPVGAAHSGPPGSGRGWHRAGRVHRTFRTGSGPDPRGSPRSSDPRVAGLGSYSGADTRRFGHRVDGLPGDTGGRAQRAPARRAPDRSGPRIVGQRRRRGARVVLPFHAPRPAGSLRPGST